MVVLKSYFCQSFKNAVVGLASLAFSALTKIMAPFTFKFEGEMPSASSNTMSCATFSMVRNALGSMNKELTSALPFFMIGHDSEEVETSEMMTLENASGTASLLQFLA